MIKYGRESVNGILHTQGTKIVNGDGDEVILEGYGTGNWLNPEGFMIGAPATDWEAVALQMDGILDGKYSLVQPNRYDRHRSVEAVVRELCGKKYVKSFWERWYANHLAEADIKAMSELNLNSVRLVLNAEVFLEEEPGILWVEDSFKMLGKVLDWCEKYKIYAILDLHAAPGGQAGCEFDDGYDLKPRLFYDEECWNRGILLWEEFARRFGDRWIIGGYDLLNEPISLPVDREMVPKLAEFYDAAIAAIRKHDKQHMFFLEGAFFARDLSIFDHNYDPEFNNWAIHWHRYGPSPERRELYPYLLKGKEWNVPVWIGEGGATPENNAVFYNIASDYGIGFCLWCWKTADNGDRGPRCVHHRLPAEWNLIQEYCRGGSKPSYEKAIKIFDEYLENMKYEKCIKNFDTIRKSRRMAPFNLPAVGYDNLPGQGVSFSGHWEYGNLLNYRLEDHTKLIWDKNQSEPILWMDEKKMERPKDPLTCLLLEMSKDEFAVYTIRDTPDNCILVLDAYSTDYAELSVLFDDVEIGTVVLETTDMKDDCQKNCVTIPASRGGKVKLLVKNGTVQLRMLHFTVRGSEE